MLKNLFIYIYYIYNLFIYNYNGIIITTTLYNKNPENNLNIFTGNEKNILLEVRTLGLRISGM